VIASDKVDVPADVPRRATCCVSGEVDVNVVGAPDPRNVWLDDTAVTRSWLPGGAALTPMLYCTGMFTYTNGGTAHERLSTDRTLTTAGPTTVSAYSPNGDVTRQIAGTDTDPTAVALMPRVPLETEVVRLTEELITADGLWPQVTVTVEVESAGTVVSWKTTLPFAFTAKSAGKEEI